MSSKSNSPKQPKRSRPVRVADEIKTWVVERDLQQGDKLPNETEMIAQFGVSKGTVREAMRILEAQGLIITRTGPGGGSFVDKVSANRARSLLANYFYFQNLSIADIYQMRRALEPELAASLAGRLNEAQLAEMEALAARAEQRDHVIEVAERLTQVLATPFDLSNAPATEISASIGIAIAPEHQYEFTFTLILITLDTIEQIRQNTHIHIHSIMVYG